MSARAIGEGHVSCVEFRVGVVSPDGAIRVDDPPPLRLVRRPPAGRLLARDAAGRAATARRRRDPRLPAEPAARVVPRAATWSARLRPAPEPAGAGLDPKTISDVHWFMACQYRLAFAGHRDISEHVLWPMSPDRAARAGGRALRPLHRRRRRRGLPRHLHRLRRRAVADPADPDRGLPDLPRLRSCSAGPPATRAWPCSRAWSAAATSPCRAGTRRTTRSRSPTTGWSGPKPSGCPSRRASGA